MSSYIPRTNASTVTSTQYTKVNKQPLAQSSVKLYAYAIHNILYYYFYVLTPCKTTDHYKFMVIPHLLFDTFEVFIIYCTWTSFIAGTIMDFCHLLWNLQIFCEYFPQRILIKLLHMDITTIIAQIAAEIQYFFLIYYVHVLHNLFTTSFQLLEVSSTARYINIITVCII